MAGSFNLDKIRATLDAIPEQFAGKQAEVGWFPSARYENGTPVAYVATIQEHGAPEAGIPARPFLKPAIAAHKDEWVQALSDGALGVLKGAIDAQDVLEGVGALAMGDVIAQIEGGTYQPLSPITLVLRKWAREGRAITGKTVGEAAAAYRDDPSIVAGVPNTPLRGVHGKLTATINHIVGDSG